MKTKSENLKGRDHLVDLRLDGITKLKRILQARVWRCGLDSSGSG